MRESIVDRRPRSVVRDNYPNVAFGYPNRRWLGARRRAFTHLKLLSIFIGAWYRTCCERWIYNWAGPRISYWFLIGAFSREGYSCAEACLRRYGGGVVVI